MTRFAPPPLTVGIRARGVYESRAFANFFFLTPLEMPRKPPPQPPEGLTEAQGQLWEALAAEHKDRFEPGEILQLRSLIDVARHLEDARRQLETDGLMVDGSMGQKRAHPLISLEAKLRAELATAIHDWRRACGNYY